MTLWLPCQHILLVQQNHHNTFVNALVFFSTVFWHVCGVSFLLVMSLSRTISTLLHLLYFHFAIYSHLYPLPAIALFLPITYFCSVVLSVCGEEGHCIAAETFDLKSFRTTVFG